MFKFIHAADIHLDSPLRGLERYHDAPVDLIRRASRQALENLVKLAMDEGVDFVLIAGDLYDRDWPDYNTGLHLVRQMSKLHEAGVPVVLISGNHDAANKMTKTLRMPPTIHRLADDAPGSKELTCGAVVHGQGFGTSAENENLAATYPAVLSDYFNIGMLHTSASFGKESGHDRYAPCKEEDLARKEYDYWALGHVHKRGPAWDNRRMQFPGNIQGRHIRETGAKGCLLVTVDDSHDVHTEFQALDAFRWERIELDASQCENGYEVLDRLRSEFASQLSKHRNYPLAARVQITGSSPAHDQLLAEPERWTNEVRAAAMELGGGQMWVEKVRLGTSPATTLSLPLDGPVAELLSMIDELAVDEQGLAQLGNELNDLARKLPVELREGEQPLDLTETGRMKEALQQVRHLLMARFGVGATQAAESAGNHAARSSR